MKKFLSIAMSLVLGLLVAGCNMQPVEETPTVDVEVTGEAVEVELPEEAAEAIEEAVEEEMMEEDMMEEEVTE